MLILIDVYSLTVSQNEFEKKVSLQEKDYRGVIGDPKEVQNKHVLKSPTSGRNNKMYQKHFGLLMQPPFLPTEMAPSVNKK